MQDIITIGVECGSELDKKMSQVTTGDIITYTGMMLSFIEEQDGRGECEKLNDIAVDICKYVINKAGENEVPCGSIAILGMVAANLSSSFIANFEDFLFRSQMSQL